MPEDKSVAIFGGTFNPPHIGHIFIAEKLREIGLFDEVLVMPGKVPPHKSGEIASEKHRFNMCKLSFGGIKGITVSDFEFKLAGKSYTVRTLEELKNRGIINPYLIIGADSLINFHKWFRFEEILKLARIVVYDRAGIEKKELEFAKKNLENSGGRITFLDLCPPNVSSTEIRKLISSGKSAEGLLNTETYKYIIENNIYSKEKSMEPVFSNTSAVYREKYKFYVELLRERLTEKRFYHTLCVAKEAVRLAEKYGADTEKAFLAGLLHDICKDMDKNSQLQLFGEFGIILDNVVLNAPKLWHSYLGAAYIENKLNIKDKDIINAVRYHTTARAGMSMLEKIIYLADFTSEERDYDGVLEMRKAVDDSIEKAMYEALKFSVEDLKAKGATVHSDTLNAFEEIKKIYLK